jgi:hypothetical protein
VSTQLKQQETNLIKAKTSLNSPRQQTDNSVQAPLMLQLPVYNNRALDRKANQYTPSQPNQRMLSHKLHSSSLERPSYRYSNGSYTDGTYETQQKQARFTKRPLSQDTILENPNILFSVGSTDDILKTKSSLDKTLQNK